MTAILVEGVGVLNHFDIEEEISRAAAKHQWNRVTKLRMSLQTLESRSKPIPLELCPFCGSELSECECMETI